MDAMTPAQPPARAEPATNDPDLAFEATLRDWMRDWRDRGVVLEWDNPLWKYWPTDDPSA